MDYKEKEPRMNADERRFTASYLKKLRTVEIYATSDFLLNPASGGATVGYGVASAVKIMPTEWVNS